MKKIFLLLLVLPQLSYAAEKNSDELLRLADNIAHLEGDLANIRLGWTSMLPNFLSPAYVTKVNSDFEGIKTPAQYYGQSSSFRKKLKAENKKLVFLEGYFPESEFQKRNKEIATKLKILKSLRAGFAAEELKKFIFDFHDDKLKILPPALDNLFGIEYYNVEGKISKKDYKTLEACVDTIEERSQSRYDDLRLMFHYLKLTEKDVFYDLGSGYGRVIFYGGTLNPTVGFKGVELVKERVAHVKPLAAANHLDMKNVTFIANDVLLEPFDDGTVFYMYNPFPLIMSQVVEKLRLVSQKHKIKVIYEGPFEANIENAPWLELEKDLIPERGSFKFKVYRSK